jgi:hypothetical protein
MPVPRHEAAYASKSAAYTILVSDDTLVATAAMTFTLPAASACYPGQRFQIINAITAGGLVTITPAGSDTVNGAASALTTLTACYGRHVVVSDGTSAWLVSTELPGPELRVIVDASGTGTSSHNIFTAPNDGTAWQVAAVSARFSTASTSGTLNVEVAGAAVARGSGVNQLTSTISLAGTADTTANGTVTGTTTVSAGTSINAIFAGTMTNIAGLLITVTLKRIT